MVYIEIEFQPVFDKVLVPFDIGVVYILKKYMMVSGKSFSPLWYWGGLYLIKMFCHKIQKVLVPFDIGVVYIKKLSNRQSTFRF